MPYKDPKKRKQYNTEYQRKWRNENRKRFREIQRKADKKRRPSRKEKMKLWRKQYYQKLRRAVLIKYGGNPPKCACCGESHIEFLTIDHIKGGGSKHRVQLRNISFGIYGYLNRSKHRPDLYQVLCYNCNCSQKHYPICPHKTDASDETSSTAD